MLSDCVNDKDERAGNKITSGSTIQVGTKLKVIDDKVRKRGWEYKRFQALTEGRQRESRDHFVRQTVPAGKSGDWEGSAADGRQFDGRH